MWCVVLKYVDYIGYEILPERFKSYEDAFSFGKNKGEETDRSWGIDIAPEISPNYEYDFDWWQEEGEMP